MWPGLLQVAGRPRLLARVPGQLPPPPQLVASVRRVFGAPLRAPAPLPGDPGLPNTPPPLPPIPRIAFLHPKFRFNIPYSPSPRSPLIFPISPQPRAPHFSLMFLIPSQIWELSLPQERRPAAPAAPQPLPARNSHLSQRLLGTSPKVGAHFPQSVQDRLRSGASGNLQCPTPIPFRGVWGWHQDLPSTGTGITQSPGGSRRSAGYTLPPSAHFYPLPVVKARA